MRFGSAQNRCMCNCGHEELEQAERLMKRSRTAVGVLLALFAIEIATRGNTAILLSCVVIQMLAIGWAAFLLTRRRRLLCGEAA
jgi:hypothetical protein